MILQSLLKQIGELRTQPARIVNRTHLAQAVKHQAKIRFYRDDKLQRPRVNAQVLVWFRRNFRQEPRRLQWRHDHENDQHDQQHINERGHIHKRLCAKIRAAPDGSVLTWFRDHCVVPLYGELDRCGAKMFPKAFVSEARASARAAFCDHSPSLRSGF